MLRPLELFIGLRYVRAKRRNRFISFTSFASIIGIALGLTVLITVLSVMNGFDYQISTRFFALTPEVTVLTRDSLAGVWQQYAQKITSLSEVTGVTPYVSGKGMLLKDGQVEGINAIGINPATLSRVSEIESKIVAGSFQTLQPGKYNIVLGQAIADDLGVTVGDQINLFTPQMIISLAGSFLRYRTFKVSGIFHTSSGFGYDTSVAYINLQDAQKLFPAGQGVSGFYIKLKNLYKADLISQQLQDELPAQFVVTNWTTQFGTFFQALAMEKLILFVILLFMLAIVIFNLVTTLVMVVNEKRADIAILRTLGASPGTIMRTFMIQGTIIGLIGTVFGLIGGLLLAANITAITNWVQNTFGIQLISSSVYFVNFLPSRIQMSDVLMVSLLAFGLSLLATIYPALTAFRTQPAEALRYE